MSTSEAGSSGPPTAASPRGKWGAGAKALTWIGAVLLVISLIVAAFGISSFLTVLPTGVVTATGEPGPNAIGGGGTPGDLEVYATHGERIVIWEVTPRDEGFAMHRDDVQVTGDEGAIQVRVPSVSGNSSIGEVRARTVAELVAPAEGGYTIAVSGVEGSSSSFVVAHGDSFPGFFAGIASTIVLWFLAIGGGITAVFLLVGGIVWGMLRARRPVPPQAA